MKSSVYTGVQKATQTGWNPVRKSPEWGIIGLNENKVALWWSNLWFMDFTRRLVVEQLLGSFSGFVQALVWQAVNGMLGGYMVATAPLFVQKCSMWPPHGRFPVSLTAVNLRVHKSNEKTCKRLFVDCYAEVCVRAGARTRGWVQITQGTSFNQQKSEKSNVWIWFLAYRIR